ncbi:DUF4352 domain-containing protein [Streptosporangium sp. NPDC048047]|uniref:DUF4352 domain-containing protein n=1 Tax=Streptosporangium sp. NPDC048047 TaxID=3155748 RepID=UPI0034219C47
MAHQQQGPQYPQQWQTQPGQPDFQPHHGLPPGYGYGYMPPQPPKKSNAPLILIVVGAVALLMLGGCSVVLALANSDTPDVVTATASVPPARSAQQDEAKPMDQTKPQDQVAEQESSAAQSPAGIGGTLTLHGRDPELVVDVMVTNVFDKATPANDFIKPKTGSRYVAVELRLENKGRAVYDDSPSNGAMLIDDQGQQYRSTFGDVREGVDLRGGVTVTTGDRRKGVLVFELPENVKPAKLQFALDSGFADQKGEWVLIK